MSLKSIREDLERGLKVRLRRIDHTTGKGNRTGSLVELEAAQKDVDRATSRLRRAQAIHAGTTAEVQEYAQALKNNGGTPELPEGFAVYTVPVTYSTDGNDITNTVPAADEIDGDGNPTDPEREPEPNDEDDDDPLAGEDSPTMHPETVQGSAPRTGGGRFARRGTQV